MKTRHGRRWKQGALVVSGIMFGAAIGKATIGILLDYLKPELTIVIYSAIGPRRLGSHGRRHHAHPGHRAGFMPDSPRRRARRPAVGHPQVLRPARLQRDPVHRLHVWRGRLRHRRHRAWRRVRRRRSMCRRWSGNMALYVVAGPAWSSDSVCARSRKSRSRPSEAGQNRFQTNVYIRNIRSIHE